MRYRHRKFVALILVLAAIGGLFFLPIKIPFTFRSTALIHPEKKWSLRTDMDGNFFGETKNFKTGAIESSTGFRFERGDIATLSINNYIINNAVVAIGDTLGYLYSRRVEERIQQLENLLAVEQRQLSSSTTGEKVEIINNLRQKMLLAGQQFDLAKKNYERAQVLFQDSVITANQFDQVESQYLTTKINIDITKSEYEIALTGEKPEMISLIREKIERYKREIEFLEETAQQYFLISPISGKLMFSQHSSAQHEYISIIDTSAFIVYVPVRFNYRSYLNYDLRVEFEIPGTEDIIEASIYDISNRIEFINSHQVVFIKAIVDQQSSLVIPGLSVQCKFYGDEITLREYIKRTLNIFLR
jgi:hypothetical protein